MKEDMEFLEIIKKYNNNWDNISCNPNLSYKFVKRYKDDLDLVQIFCYNKNMTNYELAELAGDDNYYWHFISYFQKLEPDFIDKFNDKIHKESFDFKEHFLFE
jgi:predicted transcriptional regulator